MPGTKPYGCYVPLWRHKSHGPSHILRIHRRQKSAQSNAKFNWWYGRLRCFLVVLNRVTHLQVDIRAIRRLNRCIVKTPRRHHRCKVILYLAVKRSLVVCATKRTYGFMMYKNMNTKSVLSLAQTWKANLIIHSGLDIVEKLGRSLYSHINGNPCESHIMFVARLPKKRKKAASVVRFKSGLPSNET